MAFLGYHLKKDGVEFLALSDGYKIKEDEKDIVSEVQMEAGNRVRKYGNMPKTTIKITLKPLTDIELRSYMTILKDGVYEFYSEEHDDYRSKEFFVDTPEISEIRRKSSYVNIAPFDVTLEQSDEVA